MTSRHPIRDYMRAHPDGVTVKELAVAVGLSEDGVRKVLYRMPDVWIYDWAKSQHNVWVAIWRCVVPPPHEPKPKLFDQKAYMREYHKTYGAGRTTKSSRKAKERI